MRSSYRRESSEAPNGAYRLTQLFAFGAVLIIGGMAVAPSIKDEAQQAVDDLVARFSGESDVRLVQSSPEQVPSDQIVEQMIQQEAADTDEASVSFTTVRVNPR